MTATQTTNLASLLSAKRADLAAPPEPEANGSLGPEPIDVEVVTTEHGEIVPVATAPPPVEYEPTYPTIPPKVVGGLPYVRDYMKLARTIHSTEMVPQAFRGRPDAILATFLRGYEMGFGPMQALDSFNVIEGKVGLTAESMRALIMDNGHQIILSDGEGCSVAKCRRKDWPEGMWAEYAFTMEDARVAGLLAPSRSGKPTAWQKYPKAMMDARATSGAGRRYFADVLAGMSYLPEEIRDFSGPDREELPSPPTTTPPPATSAGISLSTVPNSPPMTSLDTPTGPSSDSPRSSTRTPPEATDTATSPEPPSPTGAPSEQPPTPPVTNQTKRTRKPKADAEATDSDVRLETRKALTAIIAGLEANQQPLCRAFLAQRGYGDVTKLSDEGLQEAINIAAGWPDTAVVDEAEDGNAEDGNAEDGNAEDAGGQFDLHDSDPDDF